MDLRRGSYDMDLSYWNPLSGHSRVLTIGETRDVLLRRGIAKEADLNRVLYFLSVYDTWEERQG